MLIVEKKVISYRVRRTAGVAGLVGVKAPLIGRSVPAHGDPCRFNDGAAKRDKMYGA